MIEEISLPWRKIKNKFQNVTASAFTRCRFVALFFLLVVSVLSANTLEVVSKIPHKGYSEGLTFYEGYLWHALPKKILKIRPSDGEVVAEYDPGSEYSESIEWFKGKLYNLSFSNDGIYVGGMGKGKLEFKKVGKTPEVHGWGITHNGKELIITGDYSSKLYFLNPKTLEVTRVLQTENKDLEDLGWDGKFFWTSSFTQDPGQIYQIDPNTGKRLGIYKLAEPCNIIDGIAVDGEFLWITGKECPSIYKVKKPK